MCKAIFARILNDKSGFSIVEVVVAAAVLLILTVGIISSLIATSIATNKIENRATGLAIARDQIEKIRNMPYDEIGTRNMDGTYGNPPGSIIATQTISQNNHNFNIETRVSWTVESQNVYYKKIDVNISWQYPDGSLSLSTNIYGKSSLLNFGAIKVTVKDNQTLENIKNVKVTAEHTSQFKKLIEKTDQDGQVMFFVLPVGDYNISAEKSGYVTQLQQTIVVVASTTEIIILLEKTGELNVQVNSTLGSSIEEADVTISGPNSSEYSKKTNSTGDVNFTELLPGDYLIQASKQFYITNSTPARVNSDDITNILIELIPAGDLLITVSGINGQPIDQATVNILGPDNYSENYITDANGELLVNFLPAGIYQITVSKTGFQISQTNVTISTGIINNHSVVLNFL